MIMLLIGLVLLILGIWFNWKWSNILESMGGPDYGHSTFSYETPYFFGVLLIICGTILILKKLFSLSKRRDN